MNPSGPSPSTWQRGQLLDVAERTLTLVVASLRASPEDGSFARQGFPLRTQLESLLRQVASEAGSWPAEADARLLIAVLQAHDLLQAAPTERGAAAEAGGPVVLHGFARPVVVRGGEKPALTYSQYQVVRALVVAGPEGLAKGELERINSDARGILRRLSARDPDWRAVIHFPGRRGLRYRIG